MLGVKFLVVEIGILLLYAGITGRSVTALLKGDNVTTTANRSVAP